MVISYYGLSCFKIQSGDLVLAIDPFTKGGELSAPRFEAQAALFTDPKAPTKTSIAGDPLIFAVPGEYEAKDISMVGFATPEGTPFYIEWEGIKLLHLGAVQKHSSIEAILKYISVIDILFISTEATSTEAQKILSAIDPRIIIPMQLADGKKSSPETFAKEAGEKPEKMDKLTIKKKGLPTEGRRVAILDASR